MGDQGLIEYIRKYVSQGYSVEQVKQYLLKYGYNAEAVQQALDEVQGKVQRIEHVHHISKSLMITIIVVVVSLLALAFFGLKFFGGTPALLDVKHSEILTPELQPGETLIFITELKNLGGSKKVDIMLTHELISTKTKKTEIIEEETVAVETSQSSQQNIFLSEDFPPGKYRLRTTASYEGKIAITSSQIKVFKQTSKPSCSDNIQNQEEEEVDCGGPCMPCPSCDNFVQDIDEQGIDCGGPCPKCPETTEIVAETTTYVTPGFPAPVLDDTLTAEESMYKALEIANSSLMDSVRLCDTISNDDVHDRCFDQLASLVNMSRLCDSIRNTVLRDTCLIRFAYQEDYTVCQRIADQYYKRSCEQLEMVSAMTKS